MKETIYGKSSSWIRSDTMIKKFIIGIFIGLLLLISACTRSNEGENLSKGSSIDTEKALKISEKYIIHLMKEEYDEALKLCSMDLQQSNIENEQGDMKLISYKQDVYNEVGEGLVIIYKITSVKEGEARADLDDLSITVTPLEDDYKITKISSKIDKEAYVEGKSLRERRGNEVSSSPIIRLHRLPNEMYSKDNDLQYKKVAVPRDKFTSINYGYRGNSIAISTKGTTSSYIGIITIDESLGAIGKLGGGNDGDTEKGNLKGIDVEGEDISSEKPIGKEINSFDVLNNSEVNYLVFSQDEKLLLVEYQQEDKGSALRLYRAETGEREESKLEEAFPSDSYKVSYMYFTKKALCFKVENKGQGGANDKEGIYNLSLEDYAITKGEP